MKHLYLFVILLICTTVAKAHGVVAIWSSLDTNKHYVNYNDSKNVIANIGDTIYLDAVLIKYNNVNGVMVLRKFAGIGIDTINYYYNNTHCILKYVVQNHTSTRYGIDIDGILDIAFYITPIATLGINTTNAAITNFSCYINSATNELYVSFNGVPNATIIDVVNSAGHVVLQSHATPNTTIPLAQLTSGLYYVRCGTVVRKFITP